MDEHMNEALNEEAKIPWTIRQVREKSTVDQTLINHRFDSRFSDQHRQSPPLVGHRAHILYKKSKNLKIIVFDSIRESCK